MLEQPSTTTLHRAREAESRYDWLEAAEVCRKALPQSEGPSIERSVLLEKLAYAVFRAAFQTQERHEFRAAVNPAIEIYERAKKSYTIENLRTTLSMVHRCQGMIRCLQFWLVTTVSERKLLVDESAFSRALARAAGVAEGLL